MPQETPFVKLPSVRHNLSGSCAGALPDKEHPACRRLPDGLWLTNAADVAASDIKDFDFSLSVEAEQPRSEPPDLKARNAGAE